MVKISPESVTGPEQVKSSGRIATFSLWTSVFRDRGFESHRGHGYLSVVRVVCCQVEVSATS